MHWKRIWGLLVLFTVFLLTMTQYLTEETKGRRGLFCLMESGSIRVGKDGGWRSVVPGSRSLRSLFTSYWVRMHRLGQNQGKTPIFPQWPTSTRKHLTFWKFHSLLKQRHQLRIKGPNIGASRGHFTFTSHCFVCTWLLRLWMPTLS